MSSTLPTFVVGVIFIMIVANAYFKFKILKQYKYLRDKGIELDYKALTKGKTRKAYLAQLSSPHRPELEAFGKSLSNLIRFVLIGFGLLLLLFLYFYIFCA